MNIFGRNLTQKKQTLMDKKFMQIKSCLKKSLNSVAITLITLIHLIVFQNQQKNYITLMSEQKKVGHIILWEIVE